MGLELAGGKDSPEVLIPDLCASTTPILGVSGDQTNPQSSIPDRVGKEALLSSIITLSTPVPGEVTGDTEKAPGCWGMKEGGARRRVAFLIRCNILTA